jgi:hypothetical protein
MHFVDLGELSAQVSAALGMLRLRALPPAWL